MLTFRTLASHDDFGLLFWPFTAVDPAEAHSWRILDLLLDRVLQLFDSFLELFLLGFVDLGLVDHLDVFGIALTLVEAVPQDFGFLLDLFLFLHVLLDHIFVNVTLKFIYIEFFLGVLELLISLVLAFLIKYTDDLITFFLKFI